MQNQKMAGTIRENAGEIRSAPSRPWNLRYESRATYTKDTAVKAMQVRPIISALVVTQASGPGDAAETAEGMGFTTAKFWLRETRVNPIRVG